jgi:hypothetical protein
MDAAALLLVLGGAAAYLYAQHRMGALAAGRMQYQRISGPGGGWNVAIWGRMITTSRVGLGLAGAGVALGVVSFARHFLERRPAPVHEQEDHS